MNPRERKHAQEVFRTQAQVCVATEAAGEGINLQFCHLMVNYDLPWNPTRLEQRLGRIHRIGQDRDCYVFNFVATDSEEGDPIIEGRILHRLLEKLEQMNEALEGRVFDVIGEVLSLNDVNLPEMLRDVAYDPRRLDEYMEQIEAIDPSKLKEYENATGIALARGHVDFSTFQMENLEVEERRLMPRYVESQFIEAAKEVGLRIEPRADGLWRIEHVLAELRSDRLDAVKRIGKPDASYRKLTFEKHHLEQDVHLDAVLLGPGHPLYAVVDEKLNASLAPLVGRCAFYVDSQAVAPYALHFFELTIKGKTTSGKDAPLYGEIVAVREEDGQFEVVPADIILNMAAHRFAPEQVEPVDYQGAQDFLRSTYQLQCRSSCQQERQHFAEVCREYLERSFKARIDRAQVRAMTLMGQAGKKPEFKLAADEAKKYVDELTRARQDRLAGLNRLEIARTGPVRYFGSALVLMSDKPAADQTGVFKRQTDVELRRKKEVTAEDIVEQWLMEEGFPQANIQRVGAMKIGFDIRAHRVVDEQTGQIEVRRVEVKGYTRNTDINLTVNEWYKAEQLGETYWLCVVWDPLEPTHELVVIQNPAAKLDHAKKEVVTARDVRDTGKRHRR